MCGLLFVTDSYRNSVSELLAAMTHRGYKDRSGSDYIGKFGFGHIRLPIQGLSTKYDQPFHYGKWLILFVGEIFNYKELRPKAESDVEVFAEMWDMYREACFALFDGFWSAVICDTHTSVVFVFTDFLAKKPLYIHTPTNSVCSEIKPLCLLKGDLTVDKFYFSCVEKWGYCTHNNTPFNEIKKIDPSAYLVIYPPGDQITVKTNRFLNLVGREKRHLRSYLELAVRNRLVADVPVSLLLSGGLDSSILYKLVEKETHHITIFHVDNEEEEYLDLLEIPGDIKVKKLHYEDVQVSEALYFNEGPVDLGSMLPQIALSKAIREEGIVVAISGDGADECFGGYRRIAEYDSQWSDIFEELVYYHLPRLDKLMMCNTVELRCPYLSKPVVECALDIPYSDRIHKKFLKETFGDLVPGPILLREKIPLKSRQVLSLGTEWRYELVRKFKEVMNEYQRRDQS